MGEFASKILGSNRFNFISRIMFSARSSSTQVECCTYIDPCGKEMVTNQWRASECGCQSAVDIQCYNPSQCSVFDSGHMHLAESMIVEMLINLSQNNRFFCLFVFL